MDATYQPWGEFFSDLETGDIVLMKGEHKSSKLIEWFTRCDWSHCAIVVMDRDIGLPRVEGGPVLLWESNIKDATNPRHRKVVDVELGDEKDGPILDRLKERITNNEELGYDSDIAKRKLDYPRTEAMFSAIRKVIDEVHLDSFPKIPWGEMGHFVMGRLIEKAVTDNTYFCSQLVAHTYKEIGLLGSEHVDNWYAPACFGDGSWEVPLRGGTLGPEIRLDLSGIPEYPGC